MRKWGFKRYCEKEKGKENNHQHKNKGPYSQKKSPRLNLIRQKTYFLLYNWLILNYLLQFSPGLTISPGLTLF